MHWQRKIDHRLLALWERIPEKDRMHKSINVLVRYTGPDDLFKRPGIRIYSVAGDIATCSMMLSELPPIADNTDIIFIELANPLEHDL